MLLHEIELTVGEALEIGDYTITVIDLDNGEVTFRIQEPDVEEEPAEESATLRPR